MLSTVRILHRIERQLWEGIHNPPIGTGRGAVAGCEAAPQSIVLAERQKKKPLQGRGFSRIGTVMESVLT